FVFHVAGDRRFIIVNRRNDGHIRKIRQRTGDGVGCLRTEVARGIGRGHRQHSAIRLGWAECDGEGATGGYACTENITIVIGYSDGSPRFGGAGQWSTLSGYASNRGSGRIESIDVNAKRCRATGRIAGRIDRGDGKGVRAFRQRAVGGPAPVTVRLYRYRHRGCCTVYGDDNGGTRFAGAREG